MDAPATQIHRQRATGSHLVRLSQEPIQESYLTLPALPDEAPAVLLQRLYHWLAEAPHWRIVRQDVFGVAGDGPDRAGGKSHRLSGTDWPQTWVEEGNGQGAPVAGLQIQALSGIPIQPVRVGQRTVGMVYEDPWARYCYLGGLRALDLQQAREAQAQQVFDLMQEALGSVGMDFLDVFRTWFYLADILDWYDGFNAVRNAFFESEGVYDHLVPASTGIGGSNASGSALIADLIACQSRSSAFEIRALPSPLQCPAPEYGSAFSRAVELRWPGQHRVLVSGTASIAPDGRTVHVGDVDAQVTRTMEVVEAILTSRGLSWEDSVRAIGYFKHSEDIGALSRYCARRQLAPLPLVVTKNDVCRDDLLFELEVDAIRTSAS